LPQLNISLLGAPAILIGRKAIETDTRKATALLAYLAVSEQPQRRATLAALLWPDTDERKARGALRRTLSVLRSALGDRWLEAEGETVDLDRVNVRADVTEFRRAIAGGRLEEAAKLYRGDLLEGFSLRDSPQFDDWQAAQADTLRSSYAEVLARLSVDAERNGDLGAALGYAKRHLAIAPLHEPAHRELMRLHARSGDRSAALLREQFQQRPDVTRVILLNGNFGQHMAIMAGFSRCRGERIVTLDADLQNPPEEIGKLLARMDEGYDYVGGVRQQRQELLHLRLQVARPLLPHRRRPEVRLPAPNT